MQACDNNPAEWRDRVGLFTPETPLANGAGLDRFGAKPDLAAARRAIQAAGYKGERLVMMQPTDHPVNKAMSQVGAGLFKQLGLSVGTQAMDAGAMFQRRAKREGVDKGGWSCFLSMACGADTLNPALSYPTRGNGGAAGYGWPTIPELEAARAAWFGAPDLAAERALCGQMQMAVLDHAPHMHLGRILQATCFRTRHPGWVCQVLKCHKGVETLLLPERCARAVTGSAFP